ncbi:MAG: transposase [Bacillota bacterium]
MRTRPPYPLEFKAEAVRLVQDNGKKMTEVARDLRVSTESLRKWIRKYEIDTGQRAGLTTAEREELQRLRRENRILREEREILKKAAAFFTTLRPTAHANQRKCVSKINFTILQCSI